MRLAFICNEFPPRRHGGIGTFIKSFATALTADGHGVSVLEIGQESTIRTCDGVRVVTLQGCKMPKIGNFITRLRIRRWLSDQASRGLLDLVECPDYMGLLPFGAPGCASVVRLHLSSTSMSVHSGKRPSSGIHRYERMTLKRNRDWIAVSRFSAQLTESSFNLKARRSALIYYPVPASPEKLPSLSGLPKNYVLYAGTVSRRKGAILLAEAARKFLPRHPDLHLVYVGGLTEDGGQSIDKVIRNILGRSLEPRLLFCGHQERSHVLSCMRSARLFAFPSTLETLGLVVLEAMDGGVPVVCTSYPPGPELVVHGVNGLLADPTSADDFSEKIHQILDDAGAAERMVAASRKTLSEKFSMGRCLSESVDFYRDSIGSISG